MLLSILLAGAVTVGALLYVALPLISRVELAPVSRADDLAARRLELVEERDRALAALKELEFDHRTGKVSDVDYRELIGPLRRRAIETLRSLEPAGLAEGAARSRRERRPRAKVRS
jgi:hypothetical protein